MSLALLTFGYSLRSIVNVFPHVECGWDRQVINHEEEKPRAQLGPLRHSRWFFTPLGQKVFAEFDSLGSFWKEVDNPIDDTVRTFDLFQFRG